MLHVPLAEVIEKVKEQTGLSEEMIRAQIDERVSRLGGLLSEEGAAYILASELGVKIFPDLSRSAEIKVKNISAGLRNVEICGKVIRIFGARSFSKEGREGIIGSFVLGDETGEVRVAVWDKRAEWLNNKILEGSKVRIRGGYCKENQGRLELHLNERSLLEVEEGAGFDINSLDVRSPYSLEEKRICELVDGDECKVFGSVVAIYLPGFYYICESCGKKVLGDGEKFSCAEHGDVKGKLASRLSFVLDDGSGVLRCVGFRYSAEKLMGFSTEEASNILTSSGGGEELLRRVNENLLGVEVELFGRGKKNDLSGEIDFLVNRVNLNPNPAAIAKRKISGLGIK